MAKALYIVCSTCDHFHRPDYFGECGNSAERFTSQQLDEKHGENGWAEQRFLNEYECPCGETWEDVWSCGCDDDCPSCGTTCSPSESTPLWDDEEDDEERKQAIIAMAREQHHSDGEVEIDDDPEISEGEDNGCYVQAWVWVSFADTKYDKEGETGA